MKGKYTNPVKYTLVKAQRAVLRAVLAPLVKWKPIELPEEGYTIIIGAHGDLPSLLIANLRCLCRVDLSGLKQVIVVFDRPRAEMAVDVEALAADEFAGLPLTFLYYTARQRFVSRAINWGWVNSWMSWCKGIAAVRTRYAMLHDFDAMLLSPDFVESRYRAIRDRDVAYLGVRYYEGNGVEPADELVTTFELMFDAAYVRDTLKPIDVFNHVRVFNGRTVDFDTFLEAQSRGGAKDTIAANLDDMVHPSQMICQYVMHMTGDRRLPLASNNLMLLPYFLFVGGDERTLNDMTEQMARPSNGVKLFGKPASPSALAPAHRAWLVKQACHLECALVGKVRPEVAAYFKAMGAELEVQGDAEAQASLDANRHSHPARPATLAPPHHS